MQIYAVGDQFIHTIKEAVQRRYLSELNTATREPYIALSATQRDAVTRLVDSSEV